MNANEAPEKLFLDATSKCGDTVFTIKNNDTDIEYVRADAFIEKVQSFLNKKDDRDYYTIGYIKRHLQELIKEICL